MHANDSCSNNNKSKIRALWNPRHIKIVQSSDEVRSFCDKYPCRVRSGRKDYDYANLDLPWEVSANENESCLLLRYALGASKTPVLVMQENGLEKIQRLLSGGGGCEDGDNNNDDYNDEGLGMCMNYECFQRATIQCPTCRLDFCSSLCHDLDMKEEDANYETRPPCKLMNTN